MAKQYPRSGGYFVLHTVLCVIASLILFFCIGNTIALRRLSASDALPSQLRSARLSDAGVPFTGKTVSDFILKGYVSDENVLPEDINAAVDGMGIPTFLADKLDSHFSLLRGDTDTPVRIEAEDISGLLDQITDSLYESCKLVIDDSDRQALDRAVTPALNTVNAVSDAFGSSKAGRAFQRFGVSFGAYVLEILLLALLAWRWCKIRRSCGKDAAGAFKAMGWTLIIPAGLGLLLVIIGAVHALFIKDSVIGLYGVAKLVRTPYWYITITGVTFAFLLISFAGYLRANAEYKEKMPAVSTKKAPAVMQSAPPVPVRKTVCIECGKELEVGSRFCKFCGAKQEAPQPEPAAAAETSTVTCVSCGKEIAANMKFCKFCGTNQQSDENIVDAVLNGTAGLPEALEDTDSE